MCSASTELCPALAPGVLHIVTYPHGLGSGSVFQGSSAALQQHVLDATALVAGSGSSVLISCLDMQQ